VNKCDIIIPVWNQKEVTRECLESLVKHTHYPYNLVVVDNASDSDTRIFLEKFKADHKKISIDIIRNENNVGFIKAVNQAVSVTSGRYVCVLNNDTILTDGWLGEIIKISDLYAGVGVINPSSNTLGQKPAKGQSMDEYAALCRKNTGKYIELMSCIGFCMLVRRALIAEIGFFDEVFGMGNFEDTDFCMRARSKGYLSVRALGAYVYHKENVSFNIFKKYKDEFARNRVIYEARWGRSQRVLVAVFNSRTYGNAVNTIIDREVDSGNWVFVAAKNANFAEELKQRSNVHIYGFGDSGFTARLLMKILTKKKKFDVIYTDDKQLYNICRLFSAVIKPKWYFL